MGSHDFEDIVYTTASAQDAYRQACDEALHEYGHEAYNGTISTTSGVVVVNAEPMTLAQARRLSGQRIDHLNKWEHCEAIPLVAETRAEYESLGTRQVTLTLSGTVFADRDALTKAIAKDLKVKAENIANYKVAFNRSAGRHQISATPKVTALAAKEKTETRFFIIKPNEQRMPRWEDGHPSQAEARAALPKALRHEFGSIPAVECEIISMTRRVSGEPLVKATVEAKTVTVTFDVDLHKVTKKATSGTVRAGWMFYGWAAS